MRLIERLFTVVAVLLAFTGFATGPAHAGEHCHDVNNGGELVEVPCAGGSQDEAPGKSGKHYDPDELVTAISQVDGQFCTIIATVTSPQGQAAVTFDTLLAQIPVFGRPLHDIWQWIVDGLPGCPSLRPTPSAVAWSFVRSAQPPPSEPYVAPGYAITGKRAFLETHGRPTDTQHFDTVLGPLTITFDAQAYTVDWGDGSGLDKGPFPIPGRPFPDGKAAHVYTDAKPYDIVVRTTWAAHWSVANESGTLDGLTRTEHLDAFEVRQLQAVRDR
jgi:hypothetical protein